MQRHGTSSTSAMLAAAAAALLAPAAGAEPFTGYGLYHHGSVDSVEDILILPDHVFCFALTAGALDLLAPGHWKSAGDGIVLDEVKPASAPVVVGWQISQRPEDRGKVSFDFGGQSFGSQGSFLFGTSESDRPPADMRPLFGPGANGFERLYTEDRPAATRTFAFAYRPQEQRDQGPYHRLLYRLPEVPAGAGLRLRSYYDEQAATPAIHLTGRMIDGALHLDSEAFGQPAPIRPGDVATCRAALGKAEAGGEGARPGANRLQPIQVSDMVLKPAALKPAALGKPLFKTSYDEPAVP